MGFLSRVKSFLPASSRSLHAMYKELGEMHLESKAMREQLYELQHEVFEVRRQLDEAKHTTETVIVPHVQETRETLDAHAFAMDLFAWDTYVHEGETIPEAKKRFFAQIPPAQGALRTLQQCTTELLCAFDELCSEHHLSYWIAYGTLLGALRHHGFVPWDDDMDLGMLREDLEQLQEIVQADTRFRMSVVYDFWAGCIQMRFRWADENNPCFLDLFPYDVVTMRQCEPRTIKDIYRQQRQWLRDREKDDLAFWETTPYLPADDSHVMPIIKAFETMEDAIHPYRTALTQEDHCQLMWGVENVDDESAVLLPASWVFPLQRISFETIECWAPAQPEAILQQAYGDIYTIPHDLKTHYRHVDLDAFS